MLNTHKQRVTALEQIQTYNIVIIDDSEIDLELGAHIVSDLPNINVFKFVRSSDALTFLSTNEKKIDLVLCDYEMPEFNGLDILVKFRKKHTCVPFIFISGHVSLELANACKKNGATGFVVKPYSANSLLDKIEKTINYQH